MQFELDEEKAALNLSKHGIDFRDAARVFYDINRIEWYDAAHSIDEDRYNTIGKVRNVILSSIQSEEIGRESSPPERQRPTKGGCTKMVTYSITPGTPLTPEQIKRLDALKDRPIVFDEDCPEMTEEQLRQFKRVYPRREDTSPDRRIG